MRLLLWLKAKIMCRLLGHDFEESSVYQINSHEFRAVTMVCRRKGCSAKEVRY